MHWAAYLCWPVAVLHGLGTGSDTRVRWVLVLTARLRGVIAGLTGWRLAAGWPSHARSRGWPGALAVVARARRRRSLAGGGAAAARLGTAGPARRVA